MSTRINLDPSETRKGVETAEESPRAQKGARRRDTLTERNENNFRDIDRRSFLVLPAALVAALALPDMQTVQPGYAAEVQFPEEKCRAKKDTGKRVLVAYASKYGSTGKVADAIGKELCEKDMSTDVALIKNAGDLGSYQGVVIGSAIYRGKWMSAAADFVKKNKDALSRVPVAYFLVCMTMSQPTEKHRDQALSYMDPILKAVPEIKPVAIGLFAGALDYSKLSWVEKTIMELKGATEGDFRDWNSIRAWAQDPIYTKLTR